MSRAISQAGRMILLPRSIENSEISRKNLRRIGLLYLAKSVGLGEYLGGLRSTMLAMYPGDKSIESFVYLINTVIREDVHAPKDVIKAIHEEIEIPGPKSKMALDILHSGDRERIFGAKRVKIIKL